jgi:hypothetical protein
VADMVIRLRVVTVVARIPVAIAHLRVVTLSGNLMVVIITATKEAWKVTEPDTRIRIMDCLVVVCKVVLRTDKAICRVARHMVAHLVALVHKVVLLKATPAM